MKIIPTLSALLISLLTISISDTNAQTVTIYRSGAALSPTYSSVKAAIAAAINGDSLKMSPHIFYEHDVLVNKNIVIAGTYTGIDSSTIDAQRLGRVLQLANGRKLSIRDVRIINGLANKGKAKPTETIPSGDVGGGIKVDTNGVLTLSGATIVANNEAVYSGSAIGALSLTGFARDSATITLRNSVVIRGNKGSTATSRIILMGSDERSVLNLLDDVLISDNATSLGVGAGLVFVGGTPSEGGIRIVNNQMSNGSAFVAYTLILKEDLLIESNKADSFYGGVGGIFYIYGSGTLLIKKNKATYGGGGRLFHIGADSAKIIVTENIAKYGGGIYTGVIPYVTPKCKHIEISYNRADSFGGAIYASSGGGPSAGYVECNIHNNLAKFGNGIYAQSDVSQLGIANCRLYNPDADGKHRGPEIYVAGISTKLLVDSCWLGQSDTTGMIYTANPSDFEMPRWVVSNWVLNSGLPISWFSSFPLAARFKLNTGASLPAGSFPMLEGRFSATLGAFTPPLSPMKSVNEIESRYGTSISGGTTIMGIVDADTFKQTFTVSNIEEKGFEQLKIYPNPATTELYIEGAADKSLIRLYDLQGKVVLVKYIQFVQSSLPIDHLPAGQYLLKITTPQGTIGTAKVMKE